LKFEEEESGGLFKDSYKFLHTNVLVKKVWRIDVSVNVTLPLKRLSNISKL